MNNECLPTIAFFFLINIPRIISISFLNNSIASFNLVAFLKGDQFNYDKYPIWVESNVTVNVSELFLVLARLHFDRASNSNDPEYCPDGIDIDGNCRFKNLCQCFSNKQSVLTKECSTFFSMH